MFHKKLSPVGPSRLTRRYIVIVGAGIHSEKSEGEAIAEAVSAANKVRANPTLLQNNKVEKSEPHNTRTVNLRFNQLG